MLKSQLFMLTGGLVLFAFGPWLLGQACSGATPTLRDERWLRSRASRPLSSQMRDSAPRAGTSFCLQILRVCLLDVMTAECFSRNIDSSL